MPERRHDLQNRLASRDQAGNRRDQVREDWQDWHGDHHGDWHHGNWHGDANGWWDHMWSDHTALMAFGTTMWGINRAAYAFGYWGYSNPYYTESYPVSDSVVINYNEPITEVGAEAASAEATTPAGAPQPGMTDFDQARQAFYDGDYAAALAATDKALAAMPNDAVIHEFRALVLFAQGKYKEAAAGLYAVLSAGPGWDWTTLISLYPNVNVYTQQLRTLEDYVKNHPQEPDAQFVLAYQYLTMGSKNSAVRQLQSLQKLLLNDRLTKELLIMAGGPEAAGVPPTTAAPPEAAAPALNLADFHGDWSAAGSGDAKFAMTLNPDGAFVWTYTEKGSPQTVKGVYALDGDVLALQPDSGGVMLAKVTQPAGGSFNFVMLGGPPGDPGLKFTRK